jgi:hypothetical protein
LGRIETSLGLPSPPSENGGEDNGVNEIGLLRQFVGPCSTIQQKEEEKTATMLRLFRYEGWEAKVVAEPHADLGLLSVVVGDVPGLEVWDGRAWFAVEKEVAGAGMRGATMLAGRQLERLSNGRYPAGGHRVVAYGRPTFPSVPNPTTYNTADSMQAATGDEKHYRYSIVFVLRAHEPVLINSSLLETPITGKWAEPMNDVTAGAFYEKIKGQHFNINIDLAEREKQRDKIKTIKGKDGKGEDGSSWATLGRSG